MTTSTGRRCSTTTKAGRPCRGTDPPLCPAHGGGSRRPGAPPGNKNALKHGAYAKPDGPPDLPGRIRDLDRKIQGLSRYIEKLSGPEKDARYAELLALYGQLLSRLGRLMRDQRAITGEAADGRTLIRTKPVPSTFSKSPSAIKPSSFLCPAHDQNRQAGQDPQTDEQGKDGTVIALTDQGQSRQHCVDGEGRN